jgi:hypothetical protein
MVEATTDNVCSVGGNSFARGAHSVCVYKTVGLPCVALCNRSLNLMIKNSSERTAAQDAGAPALKASAKAMPNAASAQRMALVETACGYKRKRTRSRH